ncbi:MAG: flippase-like domain-containing protein [Vulcanisaeta sp.]|nr:flippase-like domain-containing protein [Vulcanisaeta sp.]MCG2886862.1 flippase-like domain-containing protein [Vulcanisaeta sp.]
MGGRNRISGEDWKRDVLFIVISILTIAITIIILVRSGLARARYEIPKYPLYLLLSELIYITQLVLIGVRLSVIFNRGIGFRVGTRELIKVAAAQTFASLLMPGFYIGGEAVSIAYLTSRGLPTTRATEGIVLRYTVDTVTLTLIVLLLYLTRVATIPYIALLITSALFIAYTVLLMSILSARLGRYIEGFLKVISSRTSLASNFIVINRDDTYGVKLTLLDYTIIFALSIAQWVLSGLNILLIFYAFGVHISLLTGILINSLYVVLTYVSILPGSAGIGELANLYILDNLGLGNYYLAYDIWFRVVTYMAPLIMLMPAFLSVTRTLTINQRTSP